MTLYRAEMLLNGDGTSMRDADVVVDASGTVVEVAARATSTTGFDERRDVQVLMPGVVNAHTHLTDADIETTVAGGEGLTAWVRRLLDRRGARTNRGNSSANDGARERDRGHERDGDQERDGGRDGASNGARDADRTVKSASTTGTTTSSAHSDSPAAIDNVLRRMRTAGTVAIGEVCNGTSTLAAVSRSGMLTRYIQEVLAFAPDRAEAALRTALEVEAAADWSDTVLPTLGVHAPYSVSPGLAASIVAHNSRLGRITYEHMAEDPAERELYVHGSGPWKVFLKELGAWDDSWPVPGVAPIELYDRLGLLGPHFAAVHLADATESEVARVAERGARVILSPTSNAHIGVRLPPLESIVRHRIAFALGTDGRGSNSSVDVFDEARLLAESFEWVDGMLLVQALTSHGADVLGFGNIGVIAQGMRPGLIAAEVSTIDESASDIARRVIVEPVSRRRLI